MAAIVQAKQAYAESVSKCEAGRQAWAMKGDEKQVEKANALIEKSLAAGQKGDSKTMQMYQDSVSLLQGGPSCLVKDPKQPDSYYEMQREIEVRANSAAVKGSGLAAGEFAMAQERTMAILRAGAPSDVSESEKAAVTMKKTELEPLLWPQEKPKATAASRRCNRLRPPTTAPQVDPQTSAAANPDGRLHVQEHPGPSGRGGGAGKARPGGAEGGEPGRVDGHSRHDAADSDGRLHAALRLQTTLPIVLLGLAAVGCAGGKATPPVSPAPRSYSIVPAPQRIQAKAGTFRLSPATRIMLSDPADAELRALADLLLVPLRAASGLPLPISSRPGDDQATDVISLRLTAGSVTSHPESYRLVVTPQAAWLSAGTTVGLFWGLQTIRQLLPPELEAGQPGPQPGWAIPALEIEDEPRFPYRAVLLDVARWFYPPEFIKKLIDLLALYKMNTSPAAPD